MTIEKRTYLDAATAKGAVDELSANGFSDVRAWFRPDRAGVAVDAAFGKGQTAAQILDRHGPVLTNEEEIVPDVFPPRAVVGLRSRGRSSATPLSDLFGWTVLSHGLSPLAPKALIDEASPLSRWLGWSTLYGSLGSPSRGGPASVAVRTPAAQEAGRGEA